MPFEGYGGAPRRIAVVGGGVSGLGAAHALADDHHVTLIESEPRLGGHARTVIAGKNGDQPVDTGFIVFNYKNYPHLSQLFQDLDVPVKKSAMSFGVSSGGVDYALASIDHVFAQRRNLVRPSFVRMVRDILKFNRQAQAIVRPGMSIADLLDELNLGAWFREYYLTPFSGAIWSTPREKMLDFPADALVRFFKNHGILDWHENHQWYTVDGGSRVYVSRMEQSLRRRGVRIRTDAAIGAIRRLNDGVELRQAGGTWERFDDVILATHADVSLSLLTDPSAEESRLLSAIRYQPNRAVLHADPSAMPRRRKVWSSWTYMDTGKSPDAPIDLSYWMNSLQGIPADDPLFVTLNRDAPIRDELVYDETVFRHPLFSGEALAAQDRIHDLNGARNTWFAGAWMANGFHEDGLKSGYDAAAGIMARREMPIAAE